MGVLWYSYYFGQQFLPILAFVLCFRYYRRAKRCITEAARKKKCGDWFSIPVVAFIVTICFLVRLTLIFQSGNCGDNYFFSVFCWVRGLLNMKLFTFDAGNGCWNILLTMPDSLILANLDAKLLRVNERLVNSLVITKEELIGEQSPTS